MLHEKQNTCRRTPGLVTWVCWVGLTALGGIVGTFLLSVVSNANTSLNGLLIWCYLASPLFFVALGQWLLLRRFIAQASWWLLTGVLGFLFVYQWAVTDFWHSRVLECESLPGDHVAPLWVYRGADAGHPGDQAIGSSPQAAALVDHRQHHRLGSWVPSWRAVSGKFLLAWVNTVLTGGSRAGCRNYLGHHRRHHGCSPYLGRTCSCEGLVMRRAGRTSFL